MAGRRLAVTVVATLGLLAACATSGPGPDPAERVTVDGLDRVRATLTRPDGEVCDLCVWLADTAEARRRGLMFVTDLGDADAMAFVYPRPHTGSFWMKHTQLPLSIAFFDPDGRYVDAFDMDPCESDPCPEFPTPEGFLVALEAPQGELSELGAVPGSRLVVGTEPCD